jgi:hypothetical protein
MDNPLQIFSVSIGKVNMTVDKEHETLGHGTEKVLRSEVIKLIIVSPWE